MTFAAIIDYTHDQELIGRLRPQHRQYLASLRDAGKLAASGPFTDAPGALIVYVADSAAAAEELLKADPFHDAGVFVSWRIRPWTLAVCDRNQFPA